MRNHWGHSWQVVPFLFFSLLDLLPSNKELLCAWVRVSIRFWSNTISEWSEIFWKEVTLWSTAWHHDPRIWLKAKWTTGALNAVAMKDRYCIGNTKESREVFKVTTSWPTSMAAISYQIDHNVSQFTMTRTQANVSNKGKFGLRGGSGLPA